MSKPRLEESARRPGEGRPAAGEIPYSGRDTTVYLSIFGLRRRKGLCIFFTADVRRRGIEGEVWTVLHHLVSHAVCLMLQRVVDLSDYELRLDERGRRLSRRVDRNAAEILPEAGQAQYGLIPDRAL